MKAYLSSTLHVIGQTILMPCLIVLIALIIVALWQVGDILVETFKERKKMKEDVPKLLRKIHHGGKEHIRETIEAVCY